MIAASQMNHAARRIRLRPIALPAEPGGWGLRFEPIGPGMLLAPSWVALFVSVMARGLFLARHRLKIGAENGSRTHTTLRSTDFKNVFLVLT